MRFQKQPSGISAEDNLGAQQKKEVEKLKKRTHQTRFQSRHQVLV
jgi:hypothetical protein